MPDGQGQPGVVDLSAVKSIEVMRGPFSALYGNSSGGVIQMLTADAPKTPEVGATVMFGSYDTKRQIMNAAGTSENIEYLLNVSNFETNGYRDHSASNKQQATAKFKINFSEDTKLTTLVNWFEQDAQDPSGLPRVAVTGVAAAPSAFQNPKGVANAVMNANTRVNRNHTQVGFNLEHAFNEHNSLNIMTYVGSRENSQILATNAQGTNARSSDISREFYGTDVRWDNKGDIVGKAYTLSVGVNYGKSKDARLDTNILAAGVPVSVPNRDEDNIVDNFDQYIQGKLSILDNVDIHAGARHTKVQLKVKDNLTAVNGNNSGSVEYRKTTPVIGAVWKVTPTFNLYANYGRGFETPTFIEAAYNSVNNGVPNLNLKPSQSRNFELGAKAFVTDNTQVNLNLFRITTEDELVVDETNVANRTVYTNANKTKRTGAELSIDSQFANNINTYFAYSLLNAKFDSSYLNKNGALIASDNHISGTYRSQVYGEIAWKYQPFGFHTAFEGRHNSRVYVNDTNTDNAPSYTIFNVRAGFEQNVKNWRFSEYLRVENLFDKDYIGSVRVNDSNLRFFEPAAGRNYLLGLSAHYKF
jgi:iron complex outermembrane receptor protein